MLTFIKSLFVREEPVICNIDMIDSQDDKYSLVPNVRLFVPCACCNKLKHINIKCC